MADHDAILDRLDRIEAELERTRGRAMRWKGLALLAFGALLVAPLTVQAGKGKQSMDLVSSDGRFEGRFTASGFEYRVDGKPRLKVGVGDDWSAISLHTPSGDPSVALGSEDGGAGLKIFSNDGTARVELSNRLLDSGAGLRLYDDDGASRATMYAGHSDGTSGVRLTDADRQPRVDIFAQPDGVSVLRTSDSEAKAVAEISVLHRSDASYRQSGMVPEASDRDPLVPMVYMLDPSGTGKLLMPVTPH